MERAHCASQEPTVQLWDHRRVYCAFLRRTTTKAALPRVSIVLADFTAIRTLRQAVPFARLERTGWQRVRLCVYHAHLESMELGAELLCALIAITDFTVTQTRHRAAQHANPDN